MDGGITTKTDARLLGLAQHDKSYKIISKTISKKYHMGQLEISKNFTKFVNPLSETTHIEILKSTYANIRNSIIYISPDRKRVVTGRKGDGAKLKN